MQYYEPYVHIPGAKVQHLVSHRTPYRHRRNTQLNTTTRIPRPACWHGNYSKYRDDTTRSDTPTPGLKLCKACVRSWGWEVFSLQRRSTMMNEVLFGMN